MADVDSTVGTIGRQSATGYRPSPFKSPMIAALALLVLVTLLTRMGEFHNPVTLEDEQFYLLTGKAMLHGQLPYVDIWDRKPIGLFLIYAGIAVLGHDSVLLYHLAAALAALGTSILIFRIGKRVADYRGGLAAGVTYLFLLPTMGGSGGQSPVFYNLLVAGAALAAFDVFVLSKPLLPRATLAMLLCGMAIQVKPTSLFEGAFFGLLFLAAEWNASRRALRVAGVAALMILIALAPTAAAFGAYAMLGHFHEMWTATAVSIFTKAPLPLADRAAHLLQYAVFLGLPTIGAIASAAINFRRSGFERRNLFIAGWLAAALLGYLSVPNFFDHYSLPLMVPFSVALAPLFQHRRFGMPLLAAILFMPVIFISNAPANAFRGHPDFDRMAGVVRSNLHGGCLYVYNGPTALYTATGACHLSPYVFPDHLETEVEAHAIPVSPSAEVERIFAHRPAVVVTQPRAFLARNNATAAIVERYLYCDYQLAAKFPTQKKRDISIWVLQPDGPHVCPRTHPPLGIVQSNGREG